MKRKSLIFTVILLLFTCLLTSCAPGYINKSDRINDADEQLIKEFRSHQNYFGQELKSLAIRYLGEVDGYNIYFVPFKGPDDVPNPQSFTKGGYTLPAASETTVIGIKGDKLYTLGNLLFETHIDIGKLYNILPEEYKQ